MFVIVHISSIGTVLGAFLATWLLRGRVPDIEHAAGIMTASYIGGGINFFAVKESYKVGEAVTNPLLVADNFVMAGLFVALLWIAGSAIFRRRFPHPHSLDADVGTARNLAAEHWQRKGISLIDIAKSLAVAFAVTGMAELLKRFFSARIPVGGDDGLALRMVQTLLTNRFVLITGVTLVVATAFHRQMTTVNGPEELGGYMLYLFLFTIGLPADLKAVLFNVPMLFVYCAIIAVTNLIVTLAVGRVFRLNLEELLLCVNATVGGPSTAAAMAISAGWSRLVLPGLLVGIWGYVIGTALGVMVIEVLLKL
jgi:uncharacterized membrane protein